MNRYGLGVGICTVSQILSLFMKRSEVGGTCPGMSRMTSSSVLLDASYHKKHEYVWFRGGDL